MRTGIGGVGLRAGSEIVRAGEAGLNPFLSLLADMLFRDFLLSLFSSNMVFDDEAAYVKDLGTSMSSRFGYSKRVGPESIRWA